MPERRKIDVGKVYYIHDGTKTGHPGLVVWKDDEKNRYLVIRLDSDKRGEISKIDRGVRHITKLSHPTDTNVINSYVRNRPMLCKRRDFGDIDLSHIRIHNDDYKIIDMIKSRKPEKSPSLK